MFTCKLATTTELKRFITVLKEQIDWANQSDKVNKGKAYELKK